MNFVIRNVRNFSISHLIVCFVLTHQTLTYALNLNKTDGFQPANNKLTVKNVANRKNDKFIRYFNKIFDELSTRNPELRQNHHKLSQKLNISLVVSERNNSRNGMEPEFYNEFTELQFPDRNKVNDTSDCECKCDSYELAEKLINEYVLSDDDDPDMDVDDNEELETLQRPYKYIPMETIELAHQRPQRVTSTAAPPVKGLVQSMTSYLSFPKFSTTDYIQLGLSVAATGILGMFGLSINPFNVYQTYFRSLEDFDNKNNFNFRQLSDNEDPISLIYQWFRSLD